MIADIAAVLEVAVWVVIAATCVLVSAAGVTAYLIIRLACGRAARHWQTRQGIRHLECFANHPANRSRKEKP